jgi:hypothetical protein
MHGIETETDPAELLLLKKWKWSFKGQGTATLICSVSVLPLGTCGVSTNTWACGWPITYRPPCRGLPVIIIIIISSSSSSSHHSVSKGQGFQFWCSVSTYAFHIAIDKSRKRVLSREQWPHYSDTTIHHSSPLPSLQFFRHFVTVGKMEILLVVACL